MMGWKDAKLRDLICDFKRGIAYSSEDISSPNGIPMMNLASIDKTGYYREGEMKFYSGRYDEADKIYPDEMLIACTDLTRDAIIIGTPIKVPNESDFFLFTMDLAKLRPNDCIDPDFLYYALKTNTYRKYIKPWASGTNVLHLNLNGVYNYTLKYPVSKNAQKSIARILLNIDKKIAINKCINHYLEAMAKQLYDYWFVQFDFPDENGRPYKSSGGRTVWNDKLKREIPENWTNATVENIEKNIITGKTPSTVIEDNFGGPIPFVTIDDIRGSLHVYETARTLTTKGADSQKTKYLPKGSLCCSCIGTVGVLGFIGDIAQTNQQINSIVFSKSYNKEYMYYSLQQHFRYSSAKTGNTILNMSKDEFAKIMIIYPESSILQKYHSQCEPIFSQIDENIKELNLLTKQRNELLPLLMNGQVSIKQLNNDL